MGKIRLNKPCVPYVGSERGTEQRDGAPFFNTQKQIRISSIHTITVAPFIYSRQAPCVHALSLALTVVSGQRARVVDAWPLSYCADSAC